MQNTRSRNYWKGFIVFSCPGCHKKVGVKKGITARVTCLSCNRESKITYEERRGLIPVSA